MTHGQAGHIEQWPVVLCHRSSEYDMCFVWCLPSPVGPTLAMCANAAGMAVQLPVPFAVRDSLSLNYLLLCACADEVDCYCVLLYEQDACVFTPNLSLFV
jgi:hypothetical protein